jgi:predicted enzyme related to lactoylglutathione lyase
MSERDSYNPGEFRWVDLATTDFDAAKSFYEDLFGWRWEAAEPVEEAAGYGFFTYEGKQVAGAGPVQDPSQPPAWSSYVSVEDADASAGKVTEAGGTVIVPPFELPAESGRMGVCQDLEGAFFSVLQERKHPGAELVNEPGAWTWNNLMSRDLDKAKDFYGKVFGWEATHEDEAPEFIWNWQLSGQRWPEGLGGLSGIGTDIPSEVPPHWQVYFAVESADATIEKVNGSGGATLFGPIDAAVGKLAVFTDPQGANFAIFESSFPEPR